MTDARQRAREAALRELRDAILNEKGYIVRAIEAYFDERMRGDARDPGDGPGAWARGWDAGHASAAGHVDKLRARVAELEAVVRAADAMRAGQRTASDRLYDAVRAKVEVPGE